MQSREKVSVVLNEAKKIIYGQDNLLEGIMIGLICEGHLLIEGMPGLGKTLSVSVMSRLCNLDFKRVQFTPDLLPSDLVGTMIYNQATQAFTTKRGPIFTQILLADEINRSPAKVQSALLEAMAEKQVTIGDQTHALNSPFVVLATQNPIEHEGTYDLPEAQLDRFMMKLWVDYPDNLAERKILDLKKQDINLLKPILEGHDLLTLSQEVDAVYVDEKIKSFIVNLVQATRPQNKFFPKKFEGVVTAGASPRAGIWLHKVSKFKAFLKGKDFVSPEEVLEVVPSILGHRMQLSYEAVVDQFKTQSIALEIAKSFL